MTWKDEQNEAENIETYQNYLIMQELKGSMTPTLEEVTRLLKAKRCNYEI